MSNLLLKRNVKPYLNKGDFFINIGAHDGQANDPFFPFIKDFNLRGVAVEPVPYNMKRLKSTMENTPGIIFEQSAISNEPYSHIYRIKEEYLEVWEPLSQMCSLSKEEILKNLSLLINLSDVIPPEIKTKFSNEALISDMIEKQPIACLSFEALLQKHNIKNFNLLNIDAEGLDYEIFDSINLDHYRPAIICIETAGFSQNERALFLQKLKKYGYQFIQRFGNFSEIFCFEKSL